MEENNSPKISVIIPVYNASEFIEDCLESISRQSFKDFEVIIVDDGSTDSTRQKIKKYTDSDTRFRLIEQKHGGVAHARNIGIDNASGEYITFLDADDAIHPQGLKFLLDAMLTTKSQICITELRKINSKEELAAAFEERIVPVVTPDVYDYEEVMKMALYQKRLLNSPCGMLIKREMLGKDRRFTNGIRFEDLDAFYRFYEGADKIVFLPAPVYFYRQTSGNTGSDWHESHLDLLDVTDKMELFFEEKYPALLSAARDRRFSAHYNTLLLMLKNEVENPAAVKRCVDVIKRGRLKAILDGNVKFKNKIGALLSIGGIPTLRLVSKI